MKHFYILKKQNIVNAVTIILFVIGFFVGLTLKIPPKTYFLENCFKKDFSLNFSSISLAQTVAPISFNLKKTEKPEKLFTADEGKEVTITESSEKIGDGIYIDNDSGYDIDVSALLQTPMPKLSKTLLILHTHTGEAYTPSPGYEYVASDAYRTQDPKYNMTAIGAIMAEELSKNKIKAIHNKTVHDYPSYSGSYDRSLKTAESEIAKNPEIGIVLDIHRDAIGSTDEYLKPVCEIDGEKHAQVLLVVGTDASGLENPNWQKNLRIALGLQKILNEKFPGIARPIGVRKERFNSHLSDSALLIEIGANGNTMEEAERAARCVSKALAHLILH